jgi:hypothetical protein
VISTGKVFLAEGVIPGVPAELKRKVTDREKEHIEENAAT